MKSYPVSILCILLLFPVIVQSKVLFWDDFEDGVLAGKWKIITGDFTEKNGVLTMTQGPGQYPSIAVNEAFDFSEGATFQASLKLGTTNDMVMPVSPTDASELPRKIPWDGPFVRICIDRGVGHPIVQSTPKGNGVDVARFAELDPIDWEKEYHWAMYLKGSAIKVYFDGKKVVDNKHTGGFTKGYLTFGGSKAVDTTIDNVVIYTGDYDRDILKKAQAVNSAGKLSISWGIIKSQKKR
ncbi:hypothetical protein FJZ31_25150 [Candidatus Poribacteria bacterium]|nr:hypothetical protein [Candidatus Poribacteria bacterium]